MRSLDEALEAVRRLHGEPGLHARMVAHGRERARELSVEAVRFARDRLQLDVREAAAEELEELPGVGPATAGPAEHLAHEVAELLADRARRLLGEDFNRLGE